MRSRYCQTQEMRTDKKRTCTVMRGQKMKGDERTRKKESGGGEVKKGRGEQERGECAKRGE